MSLKIIGYGSCLERDRIDGKYPYKDIMPKGIRRLSARLAKMVYVAVTRAVESTGVDKSDIPMILCSALSEIDAGIQLMEQIHETKGESISPTLVQNSVANAPGSVLSIGLKNTGPVLTISHSYLSGEAGLDFAENYLNTSRYKKAVVVLGDQYIQDWENRLEEARREDLKNQIAPLKLEEGVVALVVSIEEDENWIAEIQNSGVFHFASEKPDFQKILNRNQFRINEKTAVVYREFTSDRIKGKLELSRELGIAYEKIDISRNTLCFPFINCIENMGSKKFEEILFINSEWNDLGLMHVKFKK
jgi:3-oxoacyl-[acyl-carrier-protein] synthase III